VDELDDLINGLNVRGVREHDLRDKLVHERDRIVRNLKKAASVVSKLADDDDELAKVEKKDFKKVGLFRKYLILSELTFCRLAPLRVSFLFYFITLRITNVIQYFLNLIFKATTPNLLN
jgi:hypothetical protein